MPSTSATTSHDPLRDLAAVVPFVLFGSTGLKLLHPVALAAYPDTDLDLLLRPDALLPFVAAVRARGYRVTAWGEDWREDWGLADVAGRFYVRAVRDHVTIDATFECPFIDVDAAHAQATWIDGVPVCPEPLIWRLKWIKDPARCAAFASEHGLTIPASARAV